MSSDVTGYSGANIQVLKQKFEEYLKSKGLL